MIKINLLGDTLAQTGGKKPEKQPDQAIQVYAEGEGSRRASFPLLGILLALVLLSLGGVYYINLNNKLEQARRVQADLQAKKRDLEKYTQLEKTFRDQREALEKKKQVMLGLRASQRLPVHLLEELANALPDDVWFQEITQKGMSISIKGQSASFEAINQFRSRLMEKDKWFQNVNYPAADKKDRTVEFTISFDLKNSA
jgi:Tfp pilus assembly protein PilN